MNYRKFFSVSASTWSHKRNEYLDNLSLYYEYEVKYRGRNTDYLIVKKLGDYQKPPRKKDKAMRDAVYEAQIVDVIKWDNYQTASNCGKNYHKRANPFRIYITPTARCRNTRACGCAQCLARNRKRAVHTERL